MSYTYRISRTKGGMGGFLSPPGHPNHTHEVQEKRGRVTVAVGSIGSLAEGEVPGAPESLRREAQKMVDRGVRSSDLWERTVYGYFRNCYTPESGEVNASGAIIQEERTLPDERHMAVAYIRKFFPDHEPRTDLIENPGNAYGSPPCTVCGERVQYSPVEDAFVVFKTNADCDGKPHTIDL